ncbi:thiolase family protein [Nocardia fluminea]|uniref:thiolase family protein n=1 Tax=Nocardia fluminea TaxID=134984 RepID=UPI00344AF156
MTTTAMIAGVGLTPGMWPRKQPRSVAELCRTAAWAALEHAGADVGSIDAIVVGNIDGVEPTAVAGQALARALGLAGLPVFPVNTGGATGASLPQVAYQLVKGGQFESVLCLGPPTFDGVIDFQATLSAVFAAVEDELALGIGPLHIGAMYGSAYQQRYGVDDKDFASVVVKARANAQSNPYAHMRDPITVDEVLASPMIATPIRLAMACPVSSSAVALLVTTRERARELNNPLVAIRSIATNADASRIASREDLSGFHGLALGAKRVFAQSGIEDPRTDLDVIEMFSPYAPWELMQYEALGLCGPGEAAALLASGATARDGEIPFNVSGSSICTNGGVAAELAPFAYATLQLMGQAAGYQVPDARRAAAHSMGSQWFMCQTLGVLEREENDR